MVSLETIAPYGGVSLESTAQVCTLSDTHAHTHTWRHTHTHIDTHTYIEPHRQTHNKRDVSRGDGSMPSPGGAVAMGAVHGNGAPQLPRPEQRCRGAADGAPGRHGDHPGLGPLPDHLLGAERAEEGLLPRLLQGEHARTHAQRHTHTHAHAQSCGPYNSFIGLWCAFTLKGCFLWFLCHPVLVVTSVVFNHHQREKVSPPVHVHTSETPLLHICNTQGHA